MSYEYLIPPYPDQLQGQKLAYRRKRLLVWGDMGSGKTKLAVDFIANLIFHDKISRVLVVCPLEAFGIWEETLDENCPFVSYGFMGSENPVPDWSKNVIIVNYDWIAPRRKKHITRKGYEKSKIDWSIVETLLSWSPHVVIIDEGHKIKNPYARRSKALHKLGEVCEYALDLTGTPKGNKKVIDLWSQFRFLKPDLLDDNFKAHKMRYGVWGGFGGFQLLKYKNEDQLARIIEPYVFRMEVSGLPKQNFIPFPVILPPKARDLYNQMEEEFIAYVEENKAITASITLSKTMKLRQIAGGFIKDNEGVAHEVHSAKLDALRGIAENLREQGTRRIVIFANFLWEIAKITEMLSEDWNIYRVKGRVPKEEMLKFRSGDTNIMLCQASSGSISNNFQASNYTIFYSANYSLIDWQQAIKRIHRRGQEHPCFYYMLGAKGTVDMHIYRLHRKGLVAAKEFSDLIKEIKNDRSRRA